MVSITQGVYPTDTDVSVVGRLVPVIETEVPDTVKLVTSAVESEYV